MVLSKFDKNVDPSYYKQLKLLEPYLIKDDNDAAAYKYIQEFAHKYILPWNGWEKLYDMAFELGENDDKISYFDKFAEFQMFHPRDSDMLKEDYYLNKKLYFNPREYNEFYEKVYRKNNSYLKNDLNLFVQDLQYPHCNLDEIWSKYEIHSSSLPSKIMQQKYKKMKKLYARIKLADKNGDTEEWFNAVIESEHDEFIRTNVEYEIGGNLSNKKLWILYLNYLKSHNQKKMLETYSKYCRLFLDDVEMKNEYKNEMQYYGNSEVPWQNLFPWETYNPKSVEIETPEVLPPPSQAKPVNPVQCRFTPKNAVSQNFPFKLNFVYYIQKTANANILHKLATSCKYFPIKTPYLICYTFVLSSGPYEFIKFIRYHEQSLEVENCDISAFENNIYVSNVFQAYGPFEEEVVSKSLSKIARCTAKYISLEHIDLKTCEMELLLKHGNVVSLDINYGSVVDSCGVHMKLEDLLKMTPKITDLGITGFTTTSESLREMLKIPFENKFYHFAITFSDLTHLNNELFCKFLVKNCSSSCKIYPSFYFPNMKAVAAFESTVDESREFIKNFIQCHWNEEEKPEFHFYY